MEILIKDKTSIWYENARDEVIRIDKMLEKVEALGQKKTNTEKTLRMKEKLIVKRATILTITDEKEMKTFLRTR